MEYRRRNGVRYDTDAGERRGTEAPKESGNRVKVIIMGVAALALAGLCVLLSIIL